MEINGDQRCNCRTCGKIIKSADRFCDHCGAVQLENIERGSLDIECVIPVCPSLPSAGDSVHVNPFLPVTVLWNTARKFVEKTTLPFNMRITPQCELTGMEAVVISDVEGMGRTAKKVGFCASGQECCIDIPFKVPDGAAGQIPFVIYIRFKRDGKTTVLQGRQTHSVYREEQTPQAVHYHTSTTVKTGDGHANDQNVHVNNPGMSDLSQREKKTLWEEINNEEKWAKLELRVHAKIKLHFTKAAFRRNQFFLTANLRE